MTLCPISTAVSLGNDMATEDGTRNDPMALDILHDILFKKGRSGVRISPFCGDVSLLRHALALHGLRLPELDVVGCRDALLTHLFQGACAQREDSSLPIREDHPGCDIF